tara:strand:+ start:763 stop:1029 length:267 start_codon:yes stop_codon:yes gene_type:complete
MTAGHYAIEFGPFASSRENADDFCHGLYLAYVMDECARNIEKLQKEYDDAIERDDQELIEQKKLQLQTYQSSLMLTAYMLDESEGIST